MKVGNTDKSVVFPCLIVHLEKIRRDMQLLWGLLAVTLEAPSGAILGCYF